MPLPPHATDASRKRYELALRLVESCPPELGDEIALTGSTARGLADDDSDLEINLWSETLPPIEARVAWLEAAGVEAIEVFEQPRPDDSYWIGGKVGDVPLEVGWQRYALVEEIIADWLGSPERQPFADILASAIPFRTKGRLTQWQEQLKKYSNEVQRHAVRLAVARWSKPDYFGDMLRLARRGERLTYMSSILQDLKLMMSLLYAVNRRWQPSGKWTLTVARDLPRMPERWRERIDDILTAPPEESVHLCVELMLDALALVPPEYDVSAAVAALREAIKR